MSDETAASTEADLAASRSALIADTVPMDDKAQLIQFVAAALAQITAYPENWPDGNWHGAADEATFLDPAEAAAIAVEAVLTYLRQEAYKVVRVWD